MVKATGKGRGRALMNQTLLYGIMGGAEALVGFLLIPLYVHHLSTASFGVLQLVNVYLSLSSMLCGLGMSNSFLRAYHQTGDHQQRLQALALSIRLQLAVVLLLLCLTGLAIALPVPQRFLGTFWSPDLVLLWLAALVSGLLVTMAFAWLRAREEAVRFLRVGLAGAVSSVSFNLFFILVLHMGVEGILLANVLSNSIVSLWVLHPYWPMIFGRMPWRGELSRQLLRFGLPMVPAAVALWVIDLSDRYMLNLYHGESVVGVYSLGYKYASIMLICMTMMHTAWVPMLLRIHREESASDTRRFYLFSAAAGMLVLLALAGLLYMMRNPVLHLIAPARYAGSGDVIGVILLGFLFYGLYYVLTGVVFVSGKSRALLYGATAGGIVNVGLNLYWVPTYAAVGAAWATAIAYAALCLVSGTYLYYAARQT